MKIYFNASVSGKQKYLKEFKLITNFISRLGHEVYSDHVFKRDLKQISLQTKKQNESDFRKARDRIQKSDVMIIEGTYPSIGIGHTMTMALDSHKSVLVLTQNDPHNLLVGDPNRLLFLKRYNSSNIKDLKNTIESFLEKSNKRLLNKRFNFMIDEIEDNYLDLVSKKKNISKADYIRQLINADLKKNDDSETF